MPKIADNITELIGQTPLLNLAQYAKDQNLNAVLLGKPEYFNPTGSIKDRAALFMINQAEKEGKLKPGATIIEPTSGNTGIGLAAIATARGYNIILTMPETMSEERKKLLVAFGAELILTEAARGMEGAISKAEQLSEQIPDSFIPGQFTNPANPESHRQTTGPELWEDTDGKIDVFVAGVGTGGTITGAGEYLKSKNPKIKIIAVEPAESPLLSQKCSGSRENASSSKQNRIGPHKIQGIGAGFVPEVLNLDICDEIVTVKDQDAFQTCGQLTKKEGLLVGISSGAAVWAAAQIARRPENKGKTIVAILPDTGERYLSTTFSAPEK